MIKRLRRLLRLLPTGLALVACAALVLPVASACCCARSGVYTPADDAADGCCGGLALPRTTDGHVHGHVHGHHDGVAHEHGHGVAAGPTSPLSCDSSCSCDCVHADPPTAVAPAAASHSLDLPADVRSADLLPVPHLAPREVSDGGPQGRDPPADTGHRTIVLRR